MNKCPKCGAEFEGNFCPECGERVSKTKVCPKCGAECAGGAKFCNMCGYSFVGEPAHPQPERVERKPREFTQKTESLFKKAHNVLNVLPAWVAFIFAVLVFIFMAMPAVVTPSFEIMGEKIPSENLGSLYAAYGGMVEDVPIKGCAIAALVFAVFGAVFAFALIACRNNRTLGGERIGFLKIYSVKIQTIVRFLCMAVYLTFIIISTCAMGVISAKAEGTGLITAGVGVILLLVFSCVAFVFTLACAASDRFIILKNFPQFEEQPPERKPLTPPAEPDKLAESVKVAPPPPIPLSKRDYVPIRRFYARRKAIAVLNVFFILITAALLGLCVFPVSWSIDMKLDIFRIVLGFGGIEAVSVGVLIYLLTYLISSFRNRKKIINIDICHNKRTAICLVVSVLFTALCIIAVCYCSSHRGEPMYQVLICLNSIVLGLSFLLILIGVISLIKTKKYYFLVYGSKHPDNKPQLNEYGQKFISEQQDYVLRKNQYNHYLEILSAYKAKLKQYNLKKAMCGAGFNYNNDTERKLFWVRSHKVLAALIAVVIAVSIVLAVVLPVTLPAPEPHDLDGTYYVYSGNAYEKDNYIIITGNRWEDDDGVNGTLERNGDNLSFQSIVPGLEGEVYSGVRIGEGVLKLNIFGADIYYCIDGKTPPGASASAYPLVYDGRRVAAV